MFNGGYYTNILIHEIKCKPYNKKWLFVKHWLYLICMATVVLVCLIYAK